VRTLVVLAFGRRRETSVRGSMTTQRMPCQASSAAAARLAGPTPAIRTLPYLEDLHHATGQHVLLAVRDGHEAVLIERLSARDAGPVLYRVGGRMPLHSTGVGLVLLAHAPAAVQDEVLGRDLAPPAAGGRAGAGAGGRAAGPELRALLAAVRRDGVAVVSRPAPESVTSVAALVRDAAGAPVPALSAVAPSDRVDAAGARAAVVAVARAVSRAVAAGQTAAGSFGAELSGASRAGSRDRRPGALRAAAGGTVTGGMTSG
jgi:DNA-binding IclR family transcriptional regulator